MLAVDYAFHRYQQHNAPIEVNIDSIVTIAKEYCAMHPCTVEQGSPFSHITLIARDNLGLSNHSLSMLEQDKILSVVGQQQQAFYYAKLDQGMVMRIDSPPSSAVPFFAWYTTSFYLLLGGTIFAVLYPLFRDMFNLKTAAANFAESRQFDQLELPKSKYFQPVNDAFRWMIAKIAKLLALQKELSDTLSHELRTSISRLNFSLATLDNDNIEETKDLLQQDINELKVLVEEYLSFSQQEHFTPTLDLQVQSLVPVIEHYINLLGQYSKKRISFIDQANTAVSVDQRAIARAIKNLIDNAIKYSDSEVKITLLLQDEWLVVQIEDDGKGINTTEIDELFLPYTRSSQTKQISGYGLGLAITHKIIDWHQGELFAKQSASLKGACFQLRLPTSVE